VNQDRKTLMDDFGASAGHLAEAFERGKPDDFAMPDWQEDLLPLDMPDDLPETPERGGDDLDFSTVAGATLDESANMPDSLGAPDDALDLPALLSPDTDYHPDAPREAPAEAPTARPPEFAQWEEQDGSVVFEDDAQDTAQQQQAPEPTPLPEPDEASFLSNTLGDMFGMLEGIAAGIAALSGTKGAGAPASLNLPVGAVQLPWSGMQSAPTPEDMETYAAASPSIFDATTLSGMRGAGGHGAGSRPFVPRVDLTEPTKRFTAGPPS
jgi:hypothetical protein